MNSYFQLRPSVTRPRCAAAFLTLCLTACSPLLSAQELPQPPTRRAPPEDKASFEPAKEQVLVKVFALRHVDASQAAETLQALMGDSPDFRCAAEGTSRLLVAASAKQHAMIEKLIGELDRQPHEDEVIKLFALQNADASTISTMVKQLVPDLTVAVDIRTNSIIATGSKVDLGVAEALLLRLDHSEKPASPPRASRSDELSSRTILAHRSAGNECGGGREDDGAGP